MTLRRSLDEVTENTLERWAVALTAGELQLWELPPSVSQLYLFGHIDGAKSRQEEIDRLEHLLDIYWAHAFLTKDERRERLLKRLDAGLQQADTATWDRIERDLADMAGKRQLNSQQFELEPGQTPEIVSRNDGSSSAGSARTASAQARSRVRREPSEGGMAA